MLTARNLSKRFDAKRVFEKIDVSLDAGGFLLVTGANGSGKTTLLRVLAGLAAPTSGELQLPARELIGYLGHDPLVYRELTPLENLQLFGRLYRVPERRERIGMLLERFGLCRMLLHEPQLLVLDEPFNALDAAGAELLDETLGELSGRAFVVATHDP